MRIIDPADFEDTPQPVKGQVSLGILRFVRDAEKAKTPCRAMDVAALYDTLASTASDQEAFQADRREVRAGCWARVMLFYLRKRGLVDSRRCQHPPGVQPKGLYVLWTTTREGRVFLRENRPAS